MSLGARVQLSCMMFMEFFIWGGWFVTLNSYLSGLGASSSEIGMAYGTQALGAILAPFVIGLIADRFLAAQYLLGGLHIVGGGLMWYATTCTSFSLFYPVILLYMILYMPTLALVNAVALGQIHDAKKEFPKIRVWGTVGWIVAGLIIGWLGWNEMQLVNTFYMAGTVAITLGVFSFFLPHTPPSRQGETISVRDVLGLDALKLLKNKSFFIFFLSSMLICIPLAFYYENAERFVKTTLVLNNAAAQMSLGQLSETLFMFLMPLFFVRFGIKHMLAIGMLAWVARYILFALGADQISWMLYAAIILHGICYDFFFVTGQIYTDQVAGEKNRSSAQGLITLATYGVGMFIGFWIAGKTVEYMTFSDQTNWQNVWLVPAGISFFVLSFFMIAFSYSPKPTKT